MLADRGYEADWFRYASQDEVRILALRHQREIRFLPQLRKFRTIAVRGDGPVLLIGVP